MILSAKKALYRALLVFLPALIMFNACKEETKDESWNNKFSNKTVREIYHLKDQRDTERLLTFLSDQSIIYRKEAALAFGSVQDSDALPQLHPLLKDSAEEVRIAAAFAIGQTASPSSLPYLVSALEEENSAPVKQQIYKAAGKCAKNPKDLNIFLSALKKDTCCADAQLWGLYYAGLKKVFSGGHSEMDFIINTLKGNNIEAKLAASAYLARFPERIMQNNEAELLGLSMASEELYIKNNLIRSLSALSSQEVSDYLNQLLSDTSADYRWKVNALRALSNKEYDDVVPLFWKALNDQNASVRIIAADYLKDRVPKKDIRRLIDTAKEQKDIRVKAALLKRCKMLDSRKEVDDYVWEVKNSIDNPYDAAFLVETDAEDRYGLELLESIVAADTAAILKTTAFSAYLDQLNNEDFFSRLDKNGEEKERYVYNFKNAVNKGDVAFTYLGATALQDSTSILRKWISDYSFLQEAINKLTLPLDVEAWLAAHKALKSISDTAYQIPPKPKGNTAIDFEVLKDIAHLQEVEISTNKGNITMALFTEETPGTVAMFVDLLKQNFYNEKFIHRHVPDFVVQGGCPRGDGFGGLPETIRSEFSLREYDQEGYLGIASAGKDTESCQFFITHSPTPHLNGKYTIFAKVMDGMDVVNQLEVGDYIEKMGIK